MPVRHDSPGTLHYGGYLSSVGVTKKLICKGSGEGLQSQGGLGHARHAFSAHQFATMSWLFQLDVTLQHNLIQCPLPALVAST